MSCSSEPPVPVSDSRLSELINGEKLTSFDRKAVANTDAADAFYLSIKASASGSYAVAVMLARQAWLNSSGWLAERAAKNCVGASIASEEWADAAFFASLAAADFPSSGYFQKSAVKALYWQRKDSAVIEMIDSLSESAAAGDDELKLFSAVSSYRLKRDDWISRWREFLLEVDDSDLIRRGWEFFAASENDPHSFFPDLSELIEGKYLRACAKYREAAEVLESYLESALPGDAPAAYAAAVPTLERLYITLGRSRQGGRFLESAAVLSRSAGVSAEIYFTAARLYRRAGRLRDAERMLAGVIAGGERRDRVLWYSLDVAVKTDLSKAVRRLGEYSTIWDEPAYFEDVADALCSRLLRARRWRNIAELAELTDEVFGGAVADRYAYITERARQLGFIEGGMPKVRFWTDPYYRILMHEPPYMENDAAIRPPSDDELYIQGLIDRQLDDLVYEEIKKVSSGLSEKFLVSAAGHFAAKGRYLESIRIMYQFEGRFSLDGTAGLYPEAFFEEIRTASEKHDVPVQLMSGLVWKESGFQHDIVSRSGAVGLSQLMPATAADVASRMRRAAPDLNDPVENLSIGSWYLNWLVSYVGSSSSAVLAYNGGPGRVRRWAREYGHLPADLFYEAIPIAETYLYGKRVLTASAVYGMLYYDIEQNETLRIFFPDLAE